MCTGRVDLSFILRAFLKGADGVIIGGCWPHECHYVTEGNYDALGNVYLARMLLAELGISPERLRIEWIAASEGARFAEVMNDFVKTQRENGPLGTGEGIDATVLQARLEAALKLVPYIRLVERERLRIPVKSEKVYADFYASDETRRLFKELIADKLATSQLLQLLAAQPLSTAEIAKGLGLDPSEASKRVGTSSRQGLVFFDASVNRYAVVRQEQGHGY
jgi:F420-non-reducing hydrogenase iron-sulfur subunit